MFYVEHPTANGDALGELCWKLLVFSFLQLLRISLICALLQRMAVEVLLHSHSLVYWQASQDSGLSREQATAIEESYVAGAGASMARLATATVVLAIRVAGRERR